MYIFSNIRRSIGMLVLLSSIAFSQSGYLDKAIQLAISGKHQEAEIVYSEILIKNPDNIQAQLGRAHVLSWQGKYDEAEADFRKILYADSQNQEARMGYGYTLAWSKRYNDAEAQFKRVLELDPDNIEAQKALAFVALWAKNIRKAVERFNQLESQSNSDSELYVGLGQSYLLSGRQKPAREAFKKAMHFSRSNHNIKSLYHSVAFSPTIFNVALWGGYTNIDSNNEFGVRAIEISTNPIRNLSFWVRYDNSLSLDNLSLIQSNNNIATYYVGGVSNWNESFSTKLEYGHREIISSISQNIFNLEQIIFFPTGTSIKFGGLVAPRSDKISEWMTFGGFSFSLFENFRLEPIFFYSSATESDDNEQRILINSLYQLSNGSQFSAGVFYGKHNSNITQFDGDIAGGNLQWLMPVFEAHWINALLKYESTPLVNFFVASLGFRFRLEQ